MSTGRRVKFTIYGEPASKANSRRLVKVGGKPRFVKSQKALKYEQDFRYQCPAIEPLIMGDVSVTATVFYATRRPDLDESVILDCMQATRTKLPDGTVALSGGVYANDRQVKEKHIYWALDRDNPRAVIEVEELLDES